MAKTTKYYTLLVKHDGVWSIHFGDYDKQVVKEEQADVLDSNDKARTQIVMTDDTQASIETYVIEMNKKGF